MTACQGQAHMALFNVGGKIDVEAGKVTDLAYGVPSTVMEGINAMFHASRAGQFAQASTRAHRQAKNNDRMSIYLSQACITIMPRATALQILIKNYNTETLESIYGEVQSVDCLVFAPQQNYSKITPNFISEGNQDNKRNADVPTEQSTAPMTVVGRVGAINNLDDFKSLFIRTSALVQTLRRLDLIAKRM